MMKSGILIAATLLCLSLSSIAQAQDKLKALIVDGQNNHAVWPKSTIMMAHYLEQTGRFEVSVERTQYLWKAGREKAFLAMANAGEGQDLKQPKADPNFAPNFSQYDVVISNFGWKSADWPEATKKSFETYMKNGGGFVVVHAADNPWANWPEFNKMIGLGGWGGRNAQSGPYVYYNDAGEIVRDNSPGGCGGHGPQSEFLITMRNHEHPITKNMPNFWMHGKDECYSKLRGPAENMTILATACDTPALQKAGKHQPMLMVIDYHEGRVFHTTLGHDTEAFEGVGFITTFLRGSEWAATGKVTQPIPTDFPTESEASRRAFELKR